MNPFRSAIAIVCLLRAFGPVAIADELPNQVYAYEIGPRTPEAQAMMMAQAGFDGTVFDGATNMPRRLAAMDAQHLQLFFVWLTADVSMDKIVYEPGMDSSIRQLSGRNTTIWLAIKGGGPGAEERAVTASRHIADLAARSGLRVALYPHYGFYLARFSDVVRLAEAVSRSNLGVTFNLCHELRAGWPSDLDTLLQRALPRLYAMTINGADRQGTDWQTLIQPLGAGDFNVAALVRTVVRLGYRGAIGIQCYGIAESPDTLLPRTRQKWNAMWPRRASFSFSLTARRS